MPIEIMTTGTTDASDTRTTGIKKGEIGWGENEGGDKGKSQHRPCAVMRN